MTGTTDLGRQAYGLLDWLNEDPPGRIGQAQQQAADLARQAIAGGSGAALGEVRDVGLVIRRLAGMLEPGAGLSLISEQVLDLAFDSLRHPRGEHGKFVKAGTAAPSPARGGFAEAVAPAMRAPHQAPADTIGGAFGPAMRGPAGDVGKMVGDLQARFGTPGTLSGVQQHDLDALENRLRDEIGRAHTVATDLREEIHEQHRAELAVEILSIAAGVALAFVTGGGSLALAAIGPFLAKTAIERGPDIARALAKYHMVGQGRGRGVLAHPVAKSAVAAKVTAQAARKVPAAVPAMRKSRSVGLAADAAGVAQVMQYLTGLLTSNGMDPAEAQEFAAGALGNFLARNWDVLERAGISPEAVSAELPPAGEQAGTVGLAAGAEVAPEAMNDPGLPVPDDETAVAMFTAHRVDRILHELSHAIERLEAARAAAGDLRLYHCSNISRKLANALGTAHFLAANIADHYPAEAAELVAVSQTLGLATAVSGRAKAATTAHLLASVLNELTHGARHAEAMLADDPDSEEWEFDADHCGRHVTGAAEHAGKLARHFLDNYPSEARWLRGLDTITSGVTGEDGKKPVSRYDASTDGGAAFATIGGQLGALEFRFDPSQARDSGGRWTRFGGLGEAGKVISHSPEGFSVSLASGGQPVHGYMVAQQGHTHTFPEAVLHDRKALARAIDTMLMKEKGAFGPNTYLGGWVHDGKLWLEPSDNIASRDEAVREGSRRDQIAIWDVAGGQEISTGGSGGGSITEHANTQGGSGDPSWLLGPAGGGAAGGGGGAGPPDPGGIAAQLELGADLSLTVR